MVKPNLSVLVGVVLMTVAAWGGDINAPFSFDSTSVLPVGVRNVRVTGLTTAIDQAYNNQGQVEGLAASMNKSITWTDLAKSIKESNDRESLEAYLGALGKNMTDIVGDTHGVVNSRVSVTVPIMAYGLTESLTMAVAVPVIYSNTNVSTGWTANNQVADVLGKVADRRPNKAAEFKPKLQNVIQTEVSSKGYKRLENQSKSQVGDVSLVAKYLAFKERYVALALQPKIVVPTGRRKDLYNIVDVGGGDGQWDLGLNAIVDFYPLPNVSTTAVVGYTAQLPNTQAARIPEAQGESLTADIDEGTRTDLGDIVNASVGVNYQFASTWSLGVGGSVQYKGSDRYAGGRFSGERYQYLESETEQYMSTGQIALSYSTVPLFRAKRFAVPLDASVNFSKVLAGRNVKNNELTAVGLSMYF